ncbi:hypothetical protein Tco_1197088 [Tanacetum coccineum]
MVDNSTLWHRKLGYANMSLPEPKSSPLVEDDGIHEQVVQDPNRSPLLEANASEMGSFRSIKEARGHPIEQAKGELMK